MKKIQRMLYGELLRTFLLSIVSLNMLLMVENLLRLSKIISGMAGLPDILKIIILIQPQLLIMTIPISLLMATLLSYGRMNMDNEIVAMRGAGLSFIEISRPVIEFSLFTFIITLLMSTIIAPAGNRLLRNELNNIVRNGLTERIEEGMFNGDIPGMVIYVKKKSDSILKDVFISQTRKDVVITAGSGKIEKRGDGITLKLYDGMIHRAQKMKSTEIYFREYSMSVDIEDKVSKRSQELYPNELLKKAEKAEENKRIIYQIEFYRRFIFPLFNIIIGIIAPPLSLIAGRTGRPGGFATGVTFITIIYIIQILFQNLAEAKKISSVMGAWSPLIISSLIALILFIREQRR